MILLNEKELQLNEATELLAFPVTTLIFSILMHPAMVKFKQHQIIMAINNCFTNDYLQLEIEGKNIKLPPKIKKLYTVRKRELERILTNKNVVLVFNNDAYRILRISFQDIEFFKILSTGKSVEYTIDEFVKKYDVYFGTFGEFRKNVNFEKLFAPFKRIDYDALSQCAKLNLFWIGMVLRQIVKYGKDLGIEKIRFISKKIEQVSVEKV